MKKKTEGGDPEINLNEIKFWNSSNVGTNKQNLD